MLLLQEQTVGTLSTISTISSWSTRYNEIVPPVKVLSTLFVSFFFNSAENQINNVIVLIAQGS